METLNLAEQKLLLFQKILDIENESIINKLFTIVDKYVTKKKEDEIDIENIDVSSLSFEEWNEYFMENRDLKEYIPEYDMTLGEYRKKIYEAEVSESFPVENFFKKLESYV